MSIACQSLSLVTYPFRVRTLYKSVNQETSQGSNNNEARKGVATAIGDERCFLGGKVAERCQRHSFGRCVIVVRYSKPWKALVFD